MSVIQATILRCDICEREFRRNNRETMRNIRVRARSWDWAVRLDANERGPDHCPACAAVHHPPTLTGLEAPAGRIDAARRARG